MSRTSAHQALRAVIYGRNSSAKEKSITEQLDLCRLACAAVGWSVVDELSDPVSASRYAATKIRQNWSRLTAMVSAGEVDVVVLWETSRGDRKLTDWSWFLDLCQEYGTVVYIQSEDTIYDPRKPRDKKTLQNAGADSEHESALISSRVGRASRVNALGGRPVGRTTFGYVRVYELDHRNKRIYRGQSEHPEQGPVVRSIYADLAKGESLYEIAKTLNVTQVPTSRGAPLWKPNVVRDIATSQCYRPHPDNPKVGIHVQEHTVLEPGKRAYRKPERYQGTWPPLVSEALWQDVQRVLGTNSEAARKRRRDSAPGQVRYLLSASAKLLTAPCGATLCGHADRPGRRAHYQCIADGCTSVAMAESDEYVARLVVARLSRKDARALWVVDDRAVAAAEEEAERLIDELAQARASFARPGGITADSMAAKEAAMLPLIAAAQRRAQPTGAPLAVLTLLDAAKVSKDRVRPAWDALPILGKREVIASVFTSLRLTGAVTRASKWMTPEERQANVDRRITYTWREAAR
jgi:site-specific DNA recombinase